VRSLSSSVLIVGWGAQLEQSPDHHLLLSSRSPDPEVLSVDGTQFRVSRNVARVDSAIRPYSEGKLVSRLTLDLSAVEMRVGQ